MSLAFDISTTEKSRTFSSKISTFRLKISNSWRKMSTSDLEKRASPDALPRILTSYHRTLYGIPYPDIPHTTFYATICRFYPQTKLKILVEKSHGREHWLSASLPGWRGRQCASLWHYFKTGLFKYLLQLVVIICVHKYRRNHSTLYATSLSYTTRIFELTVSPQWKLIVKRNPSHWKIITKVRPATVHEKLILHSKPNLTNILSQWLNHSTKFSSRRIMFLCWTSLLSLDSLNMQWTPNSSQQGLQSWNILPRSRCCKNKAQNRSRFHLTW